MTGRLQGRRVLITSATTYMGPAVHDLFTREGADVVADTDPLTDPRAPAALVARAEQGGPLDVVVANLDLPADVSPLAEITDESWLAGFEAMVHPLMRLVRAAAPAMRERGGGSVVALTSSAPLRRMRPHAAAYVAARAAQNAFVRSAGHELASAGVRLNAIAQNFVANETYYPPAVLADPRFADRLRREVPAGRIGDPEETAELALFLATAASGFICGQVISNDGGWS